MITSTQANSGRILLAYHAKGCLCLYESLQQVPEVRQHHQKANRRAHSDDGSMAFNSIRVGHHGPIPNNDETAEVLSGRYRLLY